MIWVFGFYSHDWYRALSSYYFSQSPACRFGLFYILIYPSHSHSLHHHSSSWFLVFYMVFRFYSLPIFPLFVFDQCPTACRFGPMICLFIIMPWVIFLSLFTTVLTYGASFDFLFPFQHPLVHSTIFTSMIRPVSSM